MSIRISEFNIKINMNLNKMDVPQKSNIFFKKLKKENFYNYFKE